MNRQSTNGRKYASTALIGKELRPGYNSLTSASADQSSRLLVKRKGGDGNGYSDDEKASLLTIDILPSDTLQSLALHYRCSVNDIKRINSLISEQDFYARKTIKIPVQKFSLLTSPSERTTLEHATNRNHHTSVDDLVPISPLHTVKVVLDNDNEPQGKTPQSDQTGTSTTGDEHFDSLESVSLKSANNCRTQATENNDASGYLKKLDKDIRQTVKKTDFQMDHPHYSEALEEVLSSIQYYPELRTPNASDKKLHGADCGIKWWTVMICFFIVLLVVVFLAVFEYNRSKKG